MVAENGRRVKDPSAHDLAVVGNATKVAWKALRHASGSTMCDAGATHRCIDFFSEGGKTMCSCASCLPTGCVTKDSVVFLGQPIGVLDDIRLRCRLSCYRVCCSSCRFFVALAIGAATGDAKGYRDMPRCRSPDRLKVPDGRCHPWPCSAVCCNVSMSQLSGATRGTSSSAR